jgi:hypothetical protein
MNSATDEVFTDIETIPTQQERHVKAIRAAVEQTAADERASVEAAIAAAKAPSTYKDEQKIAGYIEAKRAELRQDLSRIEAKAAAEFESKLHATGLDGAFGEVYCIAAAVNIEPAFVHSRGADYKLKGTERTVIERFFIEVEAQGERTWRKQVVGHNVIGFDIRFLWQRCMVLGLRPPRWLPLDPKPWGGECFDTMVAWAGPRDRVKLSKLCQAFGIEDEDEIDGSEVWARIQAGDYDAVTNHCLIDVDKVRSVHARMTFRGV